MFGIGPAAGPAEPKVAVSTRQLLDEQRPVIAEPPLHGHHDDPVALVVLDRRRLAHRVLGQDAHAAELASAGEHRVHRAQRHRIEVPVQRRNGGVEQSWVGDDFLHAAGESCVDHPMRVDRRPQQVQTARHLVEQEAAARVRQPLEGLRHRGQGCHAVPLLGGQPIYSPSSPSGSAISVCTNFSIGTPEIRRTSSPMSQPNVSA